MTGSIILLKSSGLNQTCNGMLFSTEAWSSISDKEMDRMEQVDVALLKTLIKGHSKCNKAFYYLEFGVIPIRFMIRNRRLMFHQHLISREDKETIKKVYLKQKDCPIKGDWYNMLVKDFEVIGEDMCDEKVKSIAKEDYRKIVKEKIQVSAFKYLLEEKEKSKKKLKHVKYNNYMIQPYLKSKDITMKEKILLFSLRSGCHPAKLNFRKMNKNNLLCSLKCDAEESQSHIF